MADRMQTEPPLTPHEELRSRVQRLEWESEQNRQRLKEGADSFTALRDSIQEQREALNEAHKKWTKQWIEATSPKPINIKSVIAIGITIAMIIGGWIWSLARYPDREEFNAAQKSFETETRLVKEDVEEVKVEQIRLSNEVRYIRDSVERQERRQEQLDQKLDKALGAPGRRR